ncbi:large conductance mechanosensitive channel protein MscL [Nonlabens sp. Ci31]|jgi:large conductance mechanosensitive channel|uniref:large conductance mechanosensitive channel protein MscL n=1 Tax=Nonlabens sp. Ci31 TaxID=2608253 RepID=UPI0014640B37|nr:large conductance mechanosensitive channel protein MscL [Nonlabens sp. Ci31]QJP33850.1 large conductance mechanosensitive channel protein MscL [Nonlabens sp. Ci31]
MFKEFKDFIMTGNVIDLAVAVILAGAVSAVVKGFVNLIMMPIIGHFANRVDFKDLKIILADAILDADGVVIKPENAILYGEWVNTIISLVIIGFVLFLIVKAYNKARKPKAAAAPAAPAGPTKEEQLLMEIRDAIKLQK